MEAFAVGLEPKTAGRVAPKAANPKEQELRKVSRDFESVFIGMLMKSMRQTINKSKMFSSGKGGEMFEGLLDTNISTQAASGGKGIGIADVIYRKLLKNVRTTGDTLGMEGAKEGSTSKHSDGSSGGSSVFRGLHQQSVVDFANEWVG